MVTLILVLLGGTLMLVSIWCNVILALGASPESTIAIGSLIMLCSAGSFAASFNELGFSSIVVIWAVPIGATAFAVGHPTAAGMAWYAVSVAVAAILWACGGTPTKALAVALAISGLINL